MEKDDRVCERMSDSAHAEDISSDGDQQSDAYIVLEAEIKCEEPKTKENNDPYQISEEEEKIMLAALLEYEENRS